MRSPDGPLPECAEELEAKAAAAQASSRRLLSDASLRSSRGCLDGLLRGCGGSSRTAEEVAAAAAAEAAAAGDGRVAVQQVELAALPEK